MSSPSSGRDAQTDSSSRSRWCCSAPPVNRKSPRKRPAPLWQHAESWSPLRFSWRMRGERPKVGDQRAQSRIIVAGVSRHLRVRIPGVWVAHVGGEVFRRSRSPRRQRLPGNAGFLPAFAAHVVTTETVLLSDAVAGFYQGFGGMSRRRDRTEDHILVAKFDFHDSPRDLRLIGVGKNLEAWRKLGMRDHIRPHIVAVAL